MNVMIQPTVMRKSTLSVVATYVNVDKAGHFMGGLVMAEAMSETYAWCGFGTRSAAALGTLTSWAALLEIEMRDTHFDQWGFSIPDFFTNTVGASVKFVIADRHCVQAHEIEPLYDQPAFGEVGFGCSLPDVTGV